jgi:hypothetical protein
VEVSATADGLLLNGKRGADESAGEFTRWSLVFRTVFAVDRPEFELMS